jgi:hypothetical protein
LAAKYDPSVEILPKSLRRQLGKKYDDKKIRNSYLGSFASIQLPSLPAGLSWNTNFTANGTLSISGSVIAANPIITRFSITGGNIIISGTNNTGAGGSYSLLTSTNVALPLTNWTLLTTGTFDGSGNFAVTNAASGNRSFYILRVP